MGPEAEGQAPPPPPDALRPTGAPSRPCMALSLPAMGKRGKVCGVAFQMEGQRGCGLGRRRHGHTRPGPCPEHRWGRRRQGALMGLCCSLRPGTAHRPARSAV